MNNQTEETISVTFVGCFVFPHNGATWGSTSRLCRSSNGWESASGRRFIFNMNIGRKQCEFNFAKDSTVTVYLLQCNKTFTVYITITISSLSLVHDDIPEKIMYLPFVIIRQKFINFLFPVH